MKDKWKQSLLSLAGKNKTMLFVALGAVGIVLILMSELFSPAQAKPADETPQAAGVSTQQQTEALEQRLTELLTQVNGVGEVNVMITLENTGQVQYAQNQKSDSVLQNDNATRISTEKEYVLTSAQGNRSTPLIETECMPEIKGVAVVCDGAGSIEVVSRVTQLVSTVLGIPSNRVCVIN